LELTLFFTAVRILCGSILSQNKSGGNANLSLLPNDEGVKEDETAQEAPSKIHYGDGRVGINFGPGELAVILSFHWDQNLTEEELILRAAEEAFLSTG